MLEILSYEFMVRAFVVGIAAAVLTGILGNFVVAARQSVISDMLAHVALAGVGIGVFFDTSPLWTALLVCLLASTALWMLTQNRKAPTEAISILLMTGGLSVGLLFAHLAKGKVVSFESYLFGSVLTITPTETIGFVLLAAILSAAIWFLWQPLKAVVLDPTFSQSRYGNSKWLQWSFLLMVSLTVALSLKIIGGLLISALLVIPVLSAQQFARSFNQSVGLSILINLLGVIIGITISFYLDIPTSSAIVLSLIGIYILSGLVKSFR